MRERGEPKPLRGGVGVGGWGEGRGAGGGEGLGGCLEPVVLDAPFEKVGLERGRAHLRVRKGRSGAGEGAGQRTAGEGPEREMTGLLSPLASRVYLLCRGSYACWLFSLYVPSLSVRGAQPRAMRGVVRPCRPPSESQEPLVATGEARSLASLWSVNQECECVHVCALRWRARGVACARVTTSGGSLRPPTRLLVDVDGALVVARRRREPTRTRSAQRVRPRALSEAVYRPHPRVGGVAAEA